MNSKKAKKLRKAVKSMHGNDQRVPLKSIFRKFKAKFQEETFENKSSIMRNIEDKHGKQI